MSFLIGFILVLIFLGIYHIFSLHNLKAKLRQAEEVAKENEAQIIQMDKMASLGVLAAGIAHEINNPLGFLISNLELLKNYFSNLNILTLPVGDKNIPKDELVAIVQESLEGSLRIKKIVSDLRTFSRRSETQRIKVDINQILETVLSIVWNEIKYKITVIKDFKATTAVMGDPTNLSQVFLNIIINASEAIADKGTITLSTYEDDSWIYVKISDTGIGISPEVLPKIFDPFFSTKKSGTGLGLSVSYNIIKQHGGNITVESRPSCGSTFIVQLPRSV